LSFEWFSVSNQTSHSPALRKTNKATAKTTDFSDTHANMHTHKKQTIQNITHIYLCTQKEVKKKEKQILIVVSFEH